jgi:ubiquinone/menaquinone biosynthesis C-methylase UbiE
VVEGSSGGGSTKGELDAIVNERLQRHYEAALAASYERDRAGAQWQREQEVVAELLTEGGVGPASTVLDAPVGTGRFLPLYGKIGCRVVGVDLSADMLFQAKKSLVDYPDLNISLLRGDLTRLVLVDGSVDLAVCVRFMNLVSLPVARQALSELVRVSAGRVVVGVRFYQPFYFRVDPTWVAHFGRLARRLKRWFRALVREVKAKPHHERDILSMFNQHMLKVSASRLINRAADGAPYHIYLLEPSGSPDRPSIRND